MFKWYYLSIVALIDSMLLASHIPSLRYRELYHFTAACISQVDCCKIVTSQIQG